MRNSCHKIRATAIRRSLVCRSRYGQVPARKEHPHIDHTCRTVRRDTFRYMVEQDPTFDWGARVIGQMPSDLTRTQSVPISTITGMETPLLLTEINPRVRLRLWPSI